MHDDPQLLVGVHILIVSDYVYLVRRQAVVLR